MRKNKKLLMLIAILFTTSAFAKHTNKTFLTPRSSLYNMPLEFTTWHTQLNKKKIHKWAASLEATGFYQKSVQRSDVGKYFGINATNEGVIRDYISVYGHGMTTDSDGIKAKYIIHQHDNPDDFAFGGKIKFAPYQESYGARFDYHQKLGDFFLRIDLPIVQVKNHLNTSNLTELTPLATVENYPLSGKTLADYLNGNIEMIDATGFTSDSQYALNFVKTGNHNKTVVSDIDVLFGYNFYHKRSHHAGIYIATTIPTGNKAKGQYLFEPLVGDGKFWNLGAGLDTKWRLWESRKNNIEFLFNFDMRYIFNNTQKRTLGLKKDSGEILNFGQYYLAGQKDLLPLYPMANFLTQDVKIKPNAQLEGLLGLAFNLSNFTIDLGYNLFWKNKEGATLKNSWLDDTYAIANAEYLTLDDDGHGYYGPFNPDSVYHYAAVADTGITGAINSGNIDLEAVKTPSQVTHKIYAGLGYAFNQWRYPLLMGIGADYEFASSNAALQQWALWLKLGLSF